MTGFKQRTHGIGSNRSTYCLTTTLVKYKVFGNILGFFYADDTFIAVLAYSTF